MSMKKVLAVTLSASMIMGMAVPAMAEVSPTQPPAVDAPIYSLDIVNVVVPTTYAIAFNPGGLPVDMNSDTATTESKAQILSKSYGMVNKGSKDQIFTVDLKVEDLNTDKIAFVGSEDDVDDAADGEYKIFLTAIPADTAAVQNGDGTAIEDTVAARELDDVKMTGAADKAVTLNAGENQLAFMLENGVYSAGSGLTLGTSQAADVAAAFTLDSLAANGKGVTAFTFGGKMNTNTDWSKLTSGVRITPTYSIQNVPFSGADVIDGTGAMIKMGPSVALSADGAITMSDLTADQNYAHSAVLSWDDLSNDLDSDPNMAWVVDDWSEEDGGTLIFRLNTAWLDALKGKKATITVKLTDDTTISATQQF